MAQKGRDPPRGSKQHAARDISGGKNQDLVIEFETDEAEIARVGRPTTPIQPPVAPAQQGNAAVRQPSTVDGPPREGQVSMFQYNHRRMNSIERQHAEANAATAAEQSRNPLSEDRMKVVLAEFERNHRRQSGFTREEEVGDHENDSISYSSEETTSDFSAETPIDPMRRTLDYLYKDETDNMGYMHNMQVDNHAPKHDFGNCDFHHHEREDGTCQCAIEEDPGANITCLACVGTIFGGEQNASDLLGDLDYYCNRDNDDGILSGWDRELPLWRQAMSSLLRAGELRILEGPRIFHPRPPRSQRRFGPRRSEESIVKPNMFSGTEGNRFAANRAGLEQGVRPCTEGVPFFASAQDWQFRCPNSLDPGCSLEIRRCREIRCQPCQRYKIEKWERHIRAEWYRHMEDNQIPEEDALDEDPDERDAKYDSMADAHAASLDQERYTQRPCTPNGHRYVCAQHWATTHELHQVQGLIKAHRAPPCADHVQKALDEHPDGFSSCVCEEPLDRWQCRLCFDHKIDRLKMHFAHRVTNIWSGLVSRQAIRVDVDYHKDGKWAATQERVVNNHPCLQSIQGPDPAKKYYCGAKRAIRDRGVMDCRSCGGLVVLPPRQRVPVTAPSLVYKDAPTQTKIDAPMMKTAVTLLQDQSRREEAVAPEDRRLPTPPDENSPLTSESTSSEGSGPLADVPPLLEREPSIIAAPEGPFLHETEEMDVDTSVALPRDAERETSSTFQDPLIHQSIENWVDRWVQKRPSPPSRNTGTDLDGQEQHLALPLHNQDQAFAGYVPAIPPSYFEWPPDPRSVDVGTQTTPQESPNAQVTGEGGHISSQEQEPVRSRDVGTSTDLAEEQFSHNVRVVAQATPEEQQNLDLTDIAEQTSTDVRQEPESTNIRPRSTRRDAASRRARAEPRSSQRPQVQRNARSVHERAPVVTSDRVLRRRKRDGEPLLELDDDGKTVVDQVRKRKRTG